MLLLGELVDVRGLVGLVDTAFSSISLDVGELVDAENVLLVEGGEVELASGGSSLSGRTVFDKGESLKNGISSKFDASLVPSMAPTGKTFHRHPWAYVSSPRVSCRLC